MHYQKWYLFYWQHQLPQPPQCSFSFYSKRRRFPLRSAPYTCVASFQNSTISVPGNLHEIHALTEDTSLHTMDNRIGLQISIYKLVPYLGNSIVPHTTCKPSPTTLPWLLVPKLYDINLGIYSSSCLVTPPITYCHRLKDSCKCAKYFSPTIQELVRHWPISATRGNPTFAYYSQTMPLSRSPRSCP